MRKSIQSISLSLIAATCALMGVAADASATATIIIQSRDPAGMGFNDPTPVAPVGGNPGTTLGEQRLFVYRYVADIWEKNLDSPIPIVVSAGWENLTCTASSAVLGSASAWNIWRDFSNSKPGTWYPQALANKLAGVNLSDGQEDDGTGFGNVDIKTQFNNRLGAPDCLAGSSFYLGVDGKAGSNVNFVETLLHELGHGLGFAALTTNGQTGSRYAGYPSIWEGFMYDNTQQKTWLQMTQSQRVASGVNNLKLAWRGPNVAAGQGLLSGTPVLSIATAVPGAAGFYDYTAAGAGFGTPITTPSSFGKLAVVPGQTPSSPFIGCDPFTPAQAAAVRGKTAIISRGTCSFQIKADNAEAAGATGLLIANNTTGTISAGGAGRNIPIAMISQADGNKLIAAVPQAALTGTRGNPGAVNASFGIDNSRIAGADAAGRPLLYTPTTYAPGSSVSHWDVTATPNLLMEPNINSDLGIILTAPKDLTVPLLKDLGW